VSDVLLHAETRRPPGQGGGVSIMWLWILIAAIWVTALIDRPPAAPRPGPPPEASVREPTAWEWVAQRYGDHRTDDQIRKGNWLNFAVWKGDEAEVRRALAAGANPNARYLDGCGLGYTPLMEASALGHEGLVSLLLSRGADPILGYDGDTPLSLAIARGHTGVVRRLVAAGAGPDKQ
jgi:hypothetical protein